MLFKCKQVHLSIGFEIDHSLSQESYKKIVTSEIECDEDLMKKR